MNPNTNASDAKPKNPVLATQVLADVGNLGSRVEGLGFRV